MAMNSSFGTIGTEEMALNTLRLSYSSRSLPTRTSGVGFISLFITFLMYSSVSFSVFIRFSISAFSPCKSLYASALLFGISH